MLTCPKCSNNRNEEDYECSFCGVIYSKIPKPINENVASQPKEINETANEEGTTNFDKHVGRSDFLPENRHVGNEINSNIVTTRGAKPLIIIIVCTLLLLIIIFAYNYILLQNHMDHVIRSDSRNEGISLNVHFSYYLDTDILVLNLKNIRSGTSRIDVFRAILQLAEKLKEKEFEKVILAFRGTDRYLLLGTYFAKLGKEYSFQNHVYTMRSFPENVFNTDGSKAFSSWTGGVLAVYAKQMEDFGDFHDNWYWNELDN